MKRLASILAVFGTLLVSLVPLFAGTALAAEPGNQHFTRTWQRTDLPVADLLVSRTWMWGPEGTTDLMVEPYDEAPGGERTVQYFDKSRMEITNPDGDTNSIWYVTNGLLVVELITGQMQVGDNSFEPRQPAEVPVAGDFNDPDGPTYATFGNLLDAAPKAVGDVYTERLSRSGQVANDPSLAAQDIRAGQFDDVTQHTIAQPFWNFMNSSGTVYENGQYIDALMFENPLFATGRPITEAYWAEVLIADTPTDVLMQCFERRCLTFNPSNDTGWQVEAGNVGIHYYDWRYATEEDPGNANLPPGDPDPVDPPPGNPPPADPPPADPPPGDPPTGEVPAAPYDLWVTGHVGGVNGPYVDLGFSFGDPTGPPIQAPNQTTLSGLNGAGGQPDHFNIYRSMDGAGFDLYHELIPDERRYTDDGVAYGHSYCYYVVAVNNHGTSAHSATECADIPYEPAAPRLLNPPDGYVSYDRVITFQWETVAHATGYVICISEPGAEPAHCDANDLYSTWVSGAPAAAGEASIELLDIVAPEGERTELTWTVVACNGSGHDCGGAAEYRRLTIDLRAQLTAPTLISETVDPNDPRRFTFTWDLVQGAASYVLCAAEPGANCEYDTGLTYKSGILGPQVSTYPLTIPVFLAPDDQDTNLNWSVAACDADLNCVWQYVFRSFTVELAPEGLAAPTLISPADGYTSSDPVDLTWELVEGADSYRVCWTSAPDRSCPNNPTQHSGYLPNTTDHLTIYPQPGEYTEIEWTVGACDANGDCVYQTQTRSLIIDRPLDAPNLVSANVDQQRPSRYSFFWGAVSGADYYVVCAAAPGANCPNETGDLVKFTTNDASTITLTGDIPRWLAPDGASTHLNWTVAACTDDDRCFWQYNIRSINVNRVPNPALAAPYLNSAFAPTQDPTYYEFEWDLVTGAERYVICVYEDGANCAAETGNYAKSSILGPTVDEMSMSIPAWLAPDGQMTTLRWTVGACDALLRCNWQSSNGTIYVDRS